MYGVFERDIATHDPSIATWGLEIMVIPDAGIHDACINS